MKKLPLLLALSLLFVLPGLTPAKAGVDADAAKDLFKENQCSKCHHSTRTKSGPSLKTIAEKYRGKADGEAKIIKNITTGPMVKLDDGTKEEHKIIDTKDAAQLKNLAQWILSH